MTALQLLPIIVSIVIYAVRLREINTKRDTIAGPIRENLTLALFLLVGTVTFLGSVGEYFLRGKVWSWGWLIAGVVCSVCSFTIRWKAIAALGKFWSLHVEIRENHEFVKTGPFRWMRHPVYFSMILELVAFCLILNAFFTLLIVPFIFVPVLLMRVRLEEQAMIEKFGATYEDYRKTTPAIFPYRF